MPKTLNKGQVIMRQMTIQPQAQKALVHKLALLAEKEFDQIRKDEIWKDAAKSDRLKSEDKKSLGSVKKEEPQSEKV